MPKTTPHRKETVRPGGPSAGASFVPGLLAAGLLAASVSASAVAADIGPAPSAPAVQAAPDLFPAVLPGLSLLAPSPVSAPSFRSEFHADYPHRRWDSGGEPDPAYLLQRGEYGENGLRFLAEMGDLHLKETGNTLPQAQGRGGRFSLGTGGFGNRAVLDTFAASGSAVPAPGDLLVGATGELSLRDDSARFKTILLSGRRSLDREGRRPQSGARRGDVVGFVAQLEPMKGKLAAEAEYDYAVYEQNTSDPSAALRDSAYRLKLSGGCGHSRLTALYERTGPRYRLLDAGPERDREGGSLGMQTSLDGHAFEVRLSRYNDNTESDPLIPRLYRYEGVVDYRFKGVKTLPLALQYKKTFIASADEPVGSLPTDQAEDAFSGRVNYLAGRWDLGLTAGVTQRRDRMRGQTDLATTRVGFLPKFSAGSFTVSPDLSLKRVTDYAATQRTDRYAMNLGVSGTLLEKRLDYQLKGGYAREATRESGGCKEMVGAKVKASYPLARLFKGVKPPSLGIKGEYGGIDDPARERRENDFSLLISLEGGSFL